jgi:monoamine oxidase
VVVGAGLAGLTTALKLTEHHLDVVVLEAQTRPGGRILTLRAPFSDGLYVDAGAAHVVGDPDLLSLIASAGVKVTRPHGAEGLATIQLFDGKRTRFPPGREPPERYALSEEEKQLGFGGCIRKYFGTAADADLNDLWPPPNLAHTDEKSCQQMLIELGASPGYVQSFADSFLGEGAAGTSAASALREMAGFMRDVQLSGGGRIDGGTDRLPFALADRLGDRVTYGAVVKRLEQTPDSARVVFEKGGRLQSIDAERVICAIPYTVLRHLEVEPAFSSAKHRVIRELNMVSVVRLFASFDRRYWVERGDSGDADTDLMLSLRDETDFQPGVGGVLGSYVSGENARRLSALPEADRLAAFLQIAERVHPDAQRHMAHGLSKCWDEDPFARGAYTWFKPGQMREMAALLPQSEGRIHFAGDHTSNRPGWMHGAVASALRASHEVLEAWSV